MITACLHKLPLRISVPLLLALPLLLTASVIIVIFLNHSGTASERLAYDELDQIHREILDLTSALLNQPGRINRFNANLLREGWLAPANPRAWARLWVEEVKAADGITAIDWGSTTGMAVTVSRYAGDQGLTLGIQDAFSQGLFEQFAVDPAGDIDAGPFTAVPYDPRQRPWYTAGLSADKPAWSEPYAWIAKEGAAVETLAIAYSQPYRDASGPIQGVLAAELSLEELSAALARIQVGKTGLAFILEPGGRMIARSTGTPIIDTEGRPILAWHSQDFRVAAVAAFLKERLGALAVLDAPLRHSLELDGQVQMIEVAPLRHPSGIDWLVVAVVPRADFLAEIEVGRRIVLGVALGVVLFGLGMGHLAAKVMTRPILSLVDHARRVGAGDLDSQVVLRQSPELTQLSLAMNAMTADLRDRLRIRQSLALAMDVQRNLLPRRTPRIPGLDVAGHSIYCDETGGDYYDYLDLFALPEQAIAVALGDVTGHGVAAAMVMATARGILRSRSSHQGSLSDLLDHMNDLLVDDTESGRFMTMLLMVIDPNRREMRWASAGHDMPFIYEGGTGRFVEVAGGGVPLGILAGARYAEFVLADVAPGTLFLAGTDGIWETTNGDGEFYGKERVSELLRRHADSSAEVISTTLRAELDAFRGPDRQNDDITFVVVKTLPI